MLINKPYLLMPDVNRFQIGRTLVEIKVILPENHPMKEKAVIVID
jgi:hypothetical protein